MDEESVCRLIRLELQRLARERGLSEPVKEEDHTVPELFRTKCYYLSSYFRASDLQDKDVGDQVRRILKEDIGLLRDPKGLPPELFQALAIAAFNIGDGKGVGRSKLTMRVEDFGLRHPDFLSARTAHRRWSEVKHQLAQKIYHDLMERGLIP